MNKIQMSRRRRPNDTTSLLPSHIFGTAFQHTVQRGHYLQQFQACRTFWSLKVFYLNLKLISFNSASWAQWEILLIIAL